ncbi:EamA family transporter [Brevibacterium litoralis]|uniref:EamA family transporter n=1 Tax=Brevibacterium litoralis TaxID=3138935 RepID=UPI0032EFC5AD
MQQETTTARGVGAIALAAGLFCLIFYISGVADASGAALFAWRVLLAVACYGLALVHPAVRASLRTAWTYTTRTWWRPLLFLFLSAFIGLQLWLFTWAPIHGHALDVSLGFLLLPISLVLGGRFVLHDEVTRAQWLAVGIAAVAVTLKFALTPQVSWATFVICVGYPVYFLLRRRFGMDGPMAFGLEAAALTPFAVVLVLGGHGSPASTDVLTLLALVTVGLAGAGAMAAFLAASRLLPIPLFGLLVYLEPVGLVVVSLLIGERPHGADLLVYGLLAVALSVLAVEGFRRAGAARRGR